MRSSFGAWPVGGAAGTLSKNGQAAVLKLAINLCLAAQMLTFAEGVLLAERAGVDRRQAIEVMTHSAIGSPTLKGRAPFV